MNFPSQNQRRTSQKKSAILGMVLFLISLILLLITGPFGLVYGIFYTAFKRGVKGLGAYFLELAISVDQLGNVLMQHLLNAVWIKKGGYPFGNRDETISSALGRNKQEKTLTSFARIIDRILDQLDPNHSLNSIDYHIEPSPRIIEAVCWLLIRNNKVLCSRSKNHKSYLIPGGKRNEGESEHQALIREIDEELGISLRADSLINLGVFEGPADDQPEGIRVRLSCYEGDYAGQPTPQAEIEELVWLGYQDLHLIATTDRLIFELLFQQGRLQ